MDYSNIQTTPAEPIASSMIETFRAIGYSLETAVADIIDNAISAGARNIWIERHWMGGQSIITVKDDGHGMDDEEIKKAMRPGSQNPREERSIKDLGRFGLGLKTASFSQCRRVTVLSKREDGQPNFWSWDLDYVAQMNAWNLIKWIPDGYSDKIDDLKSGTIVIWSELDRVVTPGASITDNRLHGKFSEDLERVRKHIAMTFHRFLEDGDIKLWWCGNPILPWNPFCLSEKTTQPQPEDSIIGGITVKGYVLPHQKSFSTEEACKNAEGMNGWNSHQGFYVYRGKRLLLAGGWLGLFKKEEPYKLVRIQIDIPNTQDAAWKIDIKKSQAYPPGSCREQLLSYANNIRRKGLEIYKHRGKIIKQRANSEWQPLWLEKKKDDKWFFVVNRDNNVIKSIKEMAHDNPDKAIDTLLRIVEESIPVPSVYAKESSSEEQMKEPYVDFNRDDLSSVAKRIYNNYISSGMSSEQAKALLLSTEPFNFFEDIIDSF